MSSILLSLALEATIVVSAGWDFEKFLSNIEKYKVINIQNSTTILAVIIVIQIVSEIVD